MEVVREGKDNKEKIFQLIFDNKDVGIKPVDIIRITGLSKEAVHNHLKGLMSEKRIYKNERKRYFPEISILNEFLAFSQLMAQNARLLIDREIMESAPDAELPGDIGKYPRLGLHEKLEMNIPDKIHSIGDIVKSFPWASMYFLRMVMGPILSEKYCSTHFGVKESLERCLFEFSNRIGGYITYIFLQAMYPLADPKLDSKDRSKLAKTLIEESISLEDLFEIFRYLITQLGLTGSDLNSGKYKELFELPQNIFKTLSKGLQNVYPNLYIAFENWWFHATNNSIAISSSWPASSSCLHEWEKKYLFKYGPCYYCRKCHRKSSRKLIKKKN